MKIEPGKKYQDKCGLVLTAMSDTIDADGDAVLLCGNGFFVFRRLDDLTEVPVFMETWTNQHPHHVGVPCHSAEAAAASRTPGCIGVSHIHPDGTHTMEDPTTGEAL